MFIQVLATNLHIINRLPCKILSLAAPHVGYVITHHFEDINPDT